MKRKSSRNVYKGQCRIDIQKYCEEHNIGYTAKPFFEKRGYTVIKEQHVEHKGVFITNYIMEKSGG